MSTSSPETSTDPSAPNPMSTLKALAILFGVCTAYSLLVELLLNTIGLALGAAWTLFTKTRK